MDDVSAHVEPAAQRPAAVEHQCARCRRHWSAQVVHHPSGTVVLCRYCGALQSRVVRPVEATAATPVLRLLQGAG